MRLLLVYNAAGGLRHALLDSLHKLLSPGTYPCRLCALTYGVALERPVWKAFREKHAGRLALPRSDEFAARYTGRYTYPVILKEEDGALTVFVSSEELQRLASDRELIALLEQRMAA